jgi:hypothetical protein
MSTIYYDLKYFVFKHVLLGLSQMIRFLMVELINLDSNSRFDVSVVYLWLIILLMIYDVLVDSKVLFNQFCESQDQCGPVF